MRRGSVTPPPVPGTCSKITDIEHVVILIQRTGLSITTLEATVAPVDFRSKHGVPAARSSEHNDLPVGHSCHSNLDTSATKCSSRMLNTASLDINRKTELTRPSIAPSCHFIAAHPVGVCVLHAAFVAEVSRWNGKSVPRGDRCVRWIGLLERHALIGKSTGATVASKVVIERPVLLNQDHTCSMSVILEQVPGTGGGVTEPPPHPCKPKDASSATAVSHRVSVVLDESNCA